MKHKFSIITVFLLVILFGWISLNHALASKRLIVSPPRNIRVQQIENSLVIKWKHPLRRIDGYKIYRSNSKKILGEIITTITDPSVKSFIDSSVQPNTKYYYTVRSFLNSWGESINKRQIYKIIKIPRKKVAPPPTRLFSPSYPPTITIQQYEIIDKVTINPFISFIDEPIQFTFTLRPEYYSRIQSAVMKFWLSNTQSMLEIPLTITNNQLIGELTPMQKQNLYRNSSIQIVLTIDGTEIWPANFYALFEILPFNKNDVGIYETENTTIIYPRGYENIIGNIAQEDELCYSIAREYFGKPLPTQRLYHYVEIVSTGGGATGTFLHNSFLAPDVVETYRKSKNTCAQVTLHEIIHVYFHQSLIPITNWIHEGIAEAVSRRLTNEASDDNLTCYDNYWTAYNDTQQHPYLALDGDLPLTSEYYYATPRCYLKYLAGIYNGDVEKKIIERMFDYADRGIRHDAWCNPDYRNFLREILVGSFGADIVSTSVNRFGIKDYVCL